MSDRITLKCSVCGSTGFEVPEDPRPADLIKCAGCGASNRYDVLQQQAVESAKEMVTDIFRNAFKGVKGFTIK